MKLKTLTSLLFTSIIFFCCTVKTSLTEKEKTSAPTSHYFDLVRPAFKGNIAFETTAFVEKYWRVVGNTGFNETVYKIVAKLEEAGYVLETDANPKDRLLYRIEKRALKNPTWEPVDASLSIVGEETSLLKFSTNRNMIYRNAASTPPGGVVGEIVYIENQEVLETADLKGKIVFAEMNPLKIYQAVIAEGEALGLITYDNPAYLQPEKNTTSIQFRSIPYRENLNAWGIALSYEAKEKLKSAVLKGPVKVKVDISTKIYPSEELTVVANVKGSFLPEESLVFSAHIQEPGANDNASGVGTQLEMAMLTARLIKSNKLDAKRTLTFLWGDEIISTHRYIKEKDKRFSNINWGISLDMVGENTALTGGSFLIEKTPDPSAVWTRGKDKHTEWWGDTKRRLALKDLQPHYFNDFIIDIFKKQGKYADWEVNTNPFEGGSDHTPFLKANIPGLLLWHFTDQFYHTDNDRIDKVSLETMKNVGTAALVSAYTLINADAETARRLAPVLLNAAKTRLNDEFTLSQKAIAEGKDIATETKILSAWNDWYVEVLASIEDLTPGKDEALKEDIDKAQSEVEKLTQILIGKLKI